MCDPISPCGPLATWKASCGCHKSVLNSITKGLDEGGSCSPSSVPLEPCRFLKAILRCDASKWP